MNSGNQHTLSVAFSLMKSSATSLIDFSIGLKLRKAASSGSSTAKADGLVQLSLSIAKPAGGSIPLAWSLNKTVGVDLYMSTDNKLDQNDILIKRARIENRARSVHYRLTEENETRFIGLSRLDQRFTSIVFGASPSNDCDRPDHGHRINILSKKDSGLKRYLDLSYASGDTQFAPGSYYLIAKVDPDNVFAESNENNNQDSVLVSAPNTDPVIDWISCALNSVQAEGMAGLNYPARSAHGESWA
jgi:hypothetical protein